MSKDKMPEAGEVWQWNGVKIFITCVLGDEELGEISFMDNVDRHRADELEDSYWKAEKESQKLKELLKECKQWFDWYHIDTGTGKEYIESWHKKGHEIHAKIDEVLK